MNLMKILSIIISKTVHNIVKLVKGSTSHIGGVIALKIDKNDFVTVDKHMKTNIDNIYAIRRYCKS